MKLLKDILYKAGINDVIGSTNVAVEKVCFNSREAEKFSLFVAIKGTQSDGHLYIEQAVKQGAIAIVCEKFPDTINHDITYIRVKDSAHALGYIAANFYENPSEKIKLIGITGTNGKTTTATLLYKVFKALGYKTGLLSTVTNKIDNQDVSATHTTPDALRTNQLLVQMIEKGCKYCFMEVSSHAVAQKRITGLTFSGGIFTNITHDHLDYHATFSEYIKAKKGFFDILPQDAFALYNRDDANGKIMVQNTRARVKSFGIKSPADFKCKIIENQFSGLLLNIDGSEIWTKLIGAFNAYNVLTVYATASLLGKEKLDILTALSTLDPVEGRFQYIKTNNNITGIIDYAHTPDALENVLSTIKNIRTGNEKVITVIGCGGNRDAEKRPIMAKIVCKTSDKVILTSDNPRNEDPQKIIKDMQKGVDPVAYRKTIVIADRKEAIKAACSMAEKGDIILVAGKGHEKYQEINGVKHPFDDLEILSEMLKMIC